VSGSITITGVTSDAALIRLIQDSTAIHGRLDKLTNQASSGLIGDTYAGLGTGAPVSLDLRPQIASLQAWQNNVDAATGRMTVAQTALTQMQSIAANFYAQLNNLQSVNTSEVDTIAASARDALRQVAGLLDTQDGGVYVFAGQDTGNPPVLDPDQITDITYITPGSGTAFTDTAGNGFTIDGAGNACENGAPMPGGAGTAAMKYWQGAVYREDGATLNWYAWNETQQSWSPTTPPPGPTYFDQVNSVVGSFDGVVHDAASVASATYAIGLSNAAGTSPFSAWLSQPSATLRANPPVVQVGQNQTEPVGIPASANGLIPDLSTVGSTIAGGPPASTGSYMRDVMRALATIGSLSSAQANAPGFGDLIQDTRISLSGAVDAMAQDAGVLGNVQSSLTATQTQLGDTQTALTGQVSSAEDVDMAATLSQLSQVQTQMQASYQLIATLSGLSLAKFLPAA
jgi:flagellin-like hook-associated protein FlgL